MRGIIRPVKLEDAPKLCRFADLAIGSGYYTESELKDKILQSEKDGKMCSFVLENEEDGSIHGLRLTFPPGKWSHGKGSGLLSSKWGVPSQDVAYFQSLFLSNQASGKGWGPKLSLASLAVLKNLGAKAVVTHSWVESPHQSSKKYLEKLGFKTVGLHPKYWQNVDYVCTICGKPCQCTAEEMILLL
jgi:ribosomal protein S18 acetylase RimI-like enzyme